MSDIIKAYVTGKQEGYFNVRLDYSILEENQQCRAFFMSGYKSGKIKRQKETVKESDTGKKSYNQNREAYITIMGYRASFDNWSVDSLLLKGKDKTAFEDGYQIGLLCKRGKLSERKGEDLETYMMITGYEINEESFRVYLDMLKKESSVLFSRGHNVKILCEDIKKSAIEELNNKQLDLNSNSLKR